MFVAEPEWVRISPGSDLWVDIVEFQRSYDIITKARGDLLSPEDCERLDSSVRLYRGELLEGWYYDWCREPREAFRSAYLTMLDCLMEQAELTADWRAGLMYGQLALREDRAYERAHLHVMRFHCLAGNRSAALRQFETCAAALREELEVEPDGEIQQFVQQVRRSGTSAITNGALAQLVELVPAPPPALPSIEILSRMRTVTQLLDDMREEMVHRLVTLEALLR